MRASARQPARPGRQRLGAESSISIVSPHRRPQQALDLVLEVLKTEADKPTVMQLNDKFLMSLLYAHGEAVIARIEREAAHNDRLRWLLGGVHVAPDDPLLSRMAGLADCDAWQTDHLAQRTPREPLDCASLSIAALARAWVEQYSRSDRDQDDNLFAIMDFERDLREEDPDGLIDLVLEILKIEANPVLLSLLAAGPLEDVINAATIERIEREGACQRTFSRAARRCLVLPRARRIEGAAGCADR